MKVININELKVEMYDGDISELPAARFQAFSKYVLLDAKIGGELSDIDFHIERILLFMESDKPKARIELQNLRQNLYFVMEGINPKMLAFATLVHKIDGKEQTDLTDSGIRRVWEQLNITQRHSAFDKMVDALKKKLMTS